MLPELNGKLDGYAIRVPTINVSIVDLSFIAARDTTVDEVNAIMKAASESGPLKGILNYNTAPLVSVDFNHDPASSTFDATLTKVSGRLVKVSSWYDNEWGFSNRMLDTTVRADGGEVTQVAMDASSGRSRSPTSSSSAHASTPSCASGRISRSSSDFR